MPLCSESEPLATKHRQLLHLLQLLASPAEEISLKNCKYLILLTRSASPPNAFWNFTCSNHAFERFPASPLNNEGR